MSYSNSCTIQPKPAAVHHCTLEFNDRNGEVTNNVVQTCEKIKEITVFENC